MRPSLSHLIALLALFLLAPIPARAQQQTDSATFELHGTVINSVTNQPIAGALVETADNRASFAGSDGTFAFTDLPRGQYMVTARKPGFFNPQEMGEPSGPEAWSNIPSDSGVTVKLTPEGIIYGELRTASGDPIEGISVRAQRWRINQGQKQLENAAEATSDDEGNYRLSELKPGSYFLNFQQAQRGRFAARNIRVSSAKQDQGFGIQYYPGVADTSSATSISVKAGAQIHISQVLAPLRLYEISGVVPTSNLEGGLGINVMSSSGANVENNTRIDRKTGQFRITGVPAGDYMIVANLWPPPSNNAEPRTRPLTAWLPITVNADISGIVLPFGNSISIPLELRDETSSTDSTVTHRVYVELVAKEFPQSSRGDQVPGATENGETKPAAIEDVPPGTYSVEASSQFPGYIAELRCGSVDLLRDDLTIAPGASSPAIQVTVRDDGAELDGTVTQNGRPISAGIVVYSVDYPKRSIATLADQGSFSVPNIPPGTYQVFAASNANELEFTNPVAMEKFLAHATSVTLGRRDKSTVQLQAYQSDSQP
jgi:hypothetical protein